MATIQKLTSKKRGIRYKVRIARQGNKVICATFDRKIDAETFAREHDTQARAQKYLDKEESKKHTLNDAIERYLAEGHLNELKTKVERTKQLELIKKLFGDIQLYQLTKPATISNIETILKKYQGKEDKVLSNARVNRYFSAMSHLCQIAYESWYWIDINPFRAIRRKKEASFSGRCLTDEEFKNLKKYCEENSKEEICIIVMLAICTGMRKNEIRYLSWDDVNLIERTIHLKDTKNGSPRTIPLVEPALSMLKAHAKLRNIKSNWIFVGKNSEQTTYPFSITKPWDNLKTETKITNFRFHDLRHTCGSHLAKNNVSPRIIAAILGHKTLAMVMKYSHLAVEDQRESLEEMTKKIFNNG